MKRKRRKKKTSAAAKKTGLAAVTRRYCETETEKGEKTSLFSLPRSLRRLLFLLFLLFSTKQTQTRLLRETGKNFKKVERHGSSTVSFLCFGAKKEIEGNSLDG